MDTRKSVWVVVGVVVVLGAAAGVWLAWSREEAPGPVPQAVERAMPEPPKDEPLPAREASDARVREVLEPLSPLPAWKEWLSASDLLNRLVGAADNVAEGETPRTHLDFLKPKGTFGVVERGGKLFQAPDAAARYDGFAAVIGSIDAAKAAAAYGTLRPWLRSAYHAFGYPDREFDDVARKALDRVIAAPAPESPELVSVKGALYRYEDPKVEGLSNAEKQLLRLGARNERIVQKKASGVRELVFPAAR